MKTCSTCGELKELQEFYKSKTNKDGLSGYCIACDKIKKANHYQRTREVTLARHKRWAEANPEKVKQYKRKWKNINRERVLQYKRNRRKLEIIDHFTIEEWQRLLDRYDHRCLCCGSEDLITADHIIPLSKGGSNHISNIQPLCVTCNSKKGVEIIDYRNK